LKKKDAWLANEALANEESDKTLAKEEAWLRRGVKARRNRDEGRVKRLMAMREERAARRAQAGQVRLDLGSADRSGHVVFEAEHIGKAFGPRVVVRDFSTRVMRSDRIGLVGRTAWARQRCCGCSWETWRRIPAASSAARTSRWPTSISSARNSTRNARWSIRLAMATIA
jgi:hypothetical protein